MDCWCGSNKWNTCFRATRFGLVQCSTCGVFRIDPPPLLQDSDGKQFYSNYYKKDSLSDLNSSIAFKSRFWNVVDCMPEVGEVKETVLDFGCGEGSLCSQLKEIGWPFVIGTDVSSVRISRAKKKHPTVEFFDQPLENTAIPEEFFDLIIMDNVIEHLTQPTQILRTLHRYLKLGGRIMLITPNMNSGHFRLLGRYWTPELAPHVHIFLFTQDSMQRLMESTGFIVEKKGSFHTPQYSVRDWVSRLLRGDVKGAVWRALQEMGGLYGKLTGNGAMVYAVSKKV